MKKPEENIDSCIYDDLNDFFVSLSLFLFIPEPVSKTNTINNFFLICLSNFSLPFTFFLIRFSYRKRSIKIAFSLLLFLNK